MKLAIGPEDTSASVAFLVGGAGWGDGYLLQGTKWCQAIQKAAGGAPGVQVDKLPPKATGMAGVVDKLSKTSLNGQLSNGTLDAQLGGLRGHSLVLVTHGLVAESTASAQGVLLYNTVKGESPLDVTLWTSHLDLMTTQETGSGLPEDANVVANVGGLASDADSQRTAREVRELAPFVNAIRQSIYQRVYLAACGGEHRLETFARKLAMLTMKCVYYNLATISFPKPPTAPSAAVGEVHGDDVSVVSGTKFFRDPDNAANRVRLETTTDTFFGGAQGVAL